MNKRIKRNPGTKDYSHMPSKREGVLLHSRNFGRRSLLKEKNTVRVSAGNGARDIRADKKSANQVTTCALISNAFYSWVHYAKINEEHIKQCCRMKRIKKRFEKHSAFKWIIYFI
jgi:hypothetical protein